ncbi:MAG: Dps family protein [Parvibaculaceae bacterium]
MTAKIMEAVPRSSAQVKTGIDSKDRKAIANALAGSLADTVVLMLKTQVVHWNVVGPTFFGLHKLTEEQYRNLFAAADELAERIRALGFPAPLNSKKLASLAHLGEEKELRSTGAMIQQLASDNETVARDMREVAKHAEEADDLVTQDMLTERMAYHEKAAWMLRSIISD